MSNINTSQITAVILAGGMSRRMHKIDKGLLLLNNKPLIKHIIATIDNDVSEVLINANNNQEKYQILTNKTIISDDMENFQGPLAGIAKAMKTAKTPYLLVLPCDCPAIGSKLLSSLKDNLIANNAQISVAHDGDRMQPTFALLKTNLLTSLEEYLQQGERKIDLWYKRHDLITADLSKHKNYFVNINTPNDYALALNPSNINGVAILAFCALSGTGKTTLITKLIANLKSKNIRTAFIKHAHHNFAIDKPGKDSYECYHAGAKQVLISSSEQFALINRHNNKNSEPDLFSLAKKLDLTKLDLIIVEGFKSANIQKIELHRSALNNAPIFHQDANVIAIASDKNNIKTDKITLDINNIEQISDFVCAYKNLKTTL